MNSTSADTLNDQSVEAVKVIESFIRAIHDEEFALQPELYKVHCVYNYTCTYKQEEGSYIHNTCV